MTTLGFSKQKVRNFLYEILNTQFPEARNVPPEQLDGYFKDLCAIHKVDADEAFDVIYKTVNDTAFKPNERQQAVLKAVSHPTFLDLPQDLCVWFSAIHILHVLGDSGHRVSDVASKDAMFLVSILPQSAYRHTIFKTNLDVPFEKAGDILHGFRTHILRQSGKLAAQRGHAQSEQDFADEPKKPVDLREALKHALAFEAPERVFWFEEVLRLGTSFTRADLRWMQEFKKHLIFDSDIGEAKDIYGGLVDVNQGNPPFTPREVFDTIHGNQEARDPILMAWIDKFKTKGEPQKTLAAYWDERLEEFTASRCHPELTRVILEKCETLTPPVFTLAQLAERAQLKTAELDGFLRSRNPEGRVYQDNGAGGWQLKAGTLLDNLALALGLDKAEQLLSAPSEPPIRKAAAEIARPVLNVWQQAGYPADMGVRFGGQYDSPKALEAVVGDALKLLNVDGTKDSAQKRALLRALKNPQDAFDEYGMPSLPHLWLMWAARPETAAQSTPATTFAALTKTFGLAPKSADVKENGYKELLWAGVNAARDGQFKGLFYEEYLASLGFEDTRRDKFKHAFHKLGTDAKLNADDQKVIAAVEAVAGRLYGNNAKGQPRLEILLGPARQTIQRMRIALNPPQQN